MRSYSDQLRNAMDHLGIRNSRPNDRDNREQLSTPLLPSNDDENDEFSSQNRGSFFSRANRSGSGHIPVAAIHTTPQAEDLNRPSTDVFTDSVFRDQLKREEEQVMREIQARKLIEEEDRKLAHRLSRPLPNRNLSPNLGNRNFEDQLSEPMILKIKIPDTPQARTTGVIKVQIPGMGIQSVQIPPGMRPGENFLISLQNDSPSFSNFGSMRVKIPDGLRSGDMFLVMLPDGRKMNAMVPRGRRGGDEMELEVLSDFNVRHDMRRIGSAGDGVGIRDGNEIVFLEDSEVLGMMSAEEKEFFKALPDDAKEDVLNEKRLMLQQERNQSVLNEGRQPYNDNWVDMVQVKIPDGLKAGDKFRIIMPNEKAVIVEVPLGINAGETIGLPADYQGVSTSANSSENFELRKDALSDEELAKLNFLKELPNDIRSEMLQNDSGLRLFFDAYKDTNFYDEGRNDLVKQVNNAEASEEPLLEMNSLQETFEDRADGKNIAVNVSNKSYKEENNDLLDIHSGQISSGTPENSSENNNLLKKEVAKMNDESEQGYHSFEKSLSLKADSHERDTAFKNEKRPGRDTETINVDVETAGQVKSPLEILREAKSKFEAKEITIEEFNIIKQRVINDL